MGKSTQKAINQRNRLSVMGEIKCCTMRPMTALPAHKMVASVSNSAALPLMRKEEGVLMAAL